jgi:hypothetical protein
MSKIKTFWTIFISMNIGILAVVFLVFIIADNRIIFSPQSVTEESGWQIDTYDTSIDLRQNGEFNVSEKISVDFGDLDKHGIYRYIPLVFERQFADNSVRDSLIKVNDIQVLQDGKKATVEKSKRKKVNFLRQDKLFGIFDEDLFLKIGDAEKTISGKHQYEIKYTVKNGITVDENGNPQIYWNATGNGWGVPIKTAKVILDSALTFDSNQCFTGSFGSTESKCTFNENAGRKEFTITNLKPGEGISIQSNINSSNKDALSQNIGGSPSERINLLLHNWFITLPILPLAAFITFWWLKGRKPKTRGIIAPRYDSPDKLTPAQAGYLLDQSIDKVELSSTIIWLAVHGFLKIKRIENNGVGIGPFRIGKSEDYILTKLEPENSKIELSGYEREIYNGLFSGGKTEVQISSLKEKFYTTVESAKKKLSTWAKNSGYMVPPNWKGILLCLFLVGIAALALLFTQSPILALTLGLSVILAIPFIVIWDRRTAAGETLKEEIEGLRLYIDTAEKDRITYLNAPERSPQFFEKLLPYAMVLGATAIWAKLYEDLYKQPPSWYDGGNYSTFHTFNAVSFANSLDAAATAMNSTMTSAPSSSGSGGSSGGGGGGGGGGSW